MLNVKYIRKINNSSSTIEDNYSLEKVEKQLSKMLLNKDVDYIKNNQLELCVTLILNPTNEELSESHKHTDRICSVLSNKLESDAHLYSVRNRLGQLMLPDSITQLLIAFGLSEYSMDRTNMYPTKDEDETPTFFVKEPKWGFEDIILNEEIKERILRAMSIIENKEIIFNEWGFSSIDKATKSIICFYGPAGTGKTMTAEAIGNYLHKNIVHSSYAEIESKWVGEGAKNLHAIFKFAEDNDSILFFDEADSFLSSRIENTESSSDKHYNRMSNELFQLLEEFNGCVIFSTNLLKDVDEAFKSRIIDSIRFELPNENARISLIKRMIPKHFPLTKPITDDEFQILSEKLEGFSGRDIRKAMLLSLAGAAQKKKKEPNLTFSYGDIAVGFEEVLCYKREMANQNGEIPNDIVEDLVQKQKFHENIVDIAIYAMLSDGVIHEKEKELLDELSMALLGTQIDEPIEQPAKSIKEICEEAKDLNDKKILLETVIRIVSIDGALDESEIEFVNKILLYLSIDNDSKNMIFDYCCKLTELNNLWLNLDLKES